MLCRLCSCVCRFLCRFCVVMLVGLLCSSCWWMVLMFLVVMLNWVLVSSCSCVSGVCRQLVLLQWLSQNVVIVSLWLFMFSVRCCSMCSCGLVDLLVVMCVMWLLLLFCQLVLVMFYIEDFGNLLNVVVFSVVVVVLVVLVVGVLVFLIFSSGLEFSRCWIFCFRCRLLSCSSWIDCSSCGVR